MAKLSAEEKAHQARLATRRARRARKKAEAEAAAAAEMEVAAENAHSDAIAQPAEASVDLSVVGGPTPAALARGSASPKRVTEARENLSSAFDLLGGVTALVAWGRKNPTEFYRIWARLIPKEVPVDASKTLPLETLLDKLSERAEMTVADAAMQIGHEELERAGKDVDMADALAAFNGTLQ